MALQTAVDIPLLIVSDNSSSERRVTPSWTLTHFKTRLEPITGIPSSSQRLTLKLGGQRHLPIEAPDEASTQLDTFPLQAYAEIHVHDVRPAALRPTFTDTSTVPKYTMPTQTYESLSDSVLAYKRANHLGRFDPTLASSTDLAAREVSERNIATGRRCQLLPAATDGRRGVVAYVGVVDELPGKERGVLWVGVALDEPVGKNDGSVPAASGGGEGKRYFECKGPRYGVFVKPERVEVGQFDVLDELGEDMEEI